MERYYWVKLYKHGNKEEVEKEWSVALIYDDGDGCYMGSDQILWKHEIAVLGPEILPPEG